MESYNNIDEYIVQFEEKTRKLLEELRMLIKNTIPESEEAIRYGIPTFRVKNKNLVHFSGNKNHIGFYPGAEAVAVFQDKLKEYKTSKGTIQFPLNHPLPHKLIKEILLYSCISLTERKNK